MIEIFSLRFEVNVIFFTVYAYLISPIFAPRKQFAPITKGAN